MRGFTFETALALVVTMQGLGGVTGGVFISAWGGLRRRRVYGVVVPYLLRVEDKAWLDQLAGSELGIDDLTVIDPQ